MVHVPDKFGKKSFGHISRENKVLLRSKEISKNFKLEEHYPHWQLQENLENQKTYIENIK